MPGRGIMGAVTVLSVVLLSGCSGRAAVPNSAASSPAPTTGAAGSPAGVPSTPPTVTAVPTTLTVVAPTTLLGLSKATERVFQGLATTAGKGFEPPPGKTKASGAYGTEKKGVIVFVAMTGDHAAPEEFLDIVASRVFKTSRFRSVKPGPLGGAARCADASSSRTPSTFCLWADTSTFGMIYFMFGLAAQADTLLARARAEIEIST